MQPQVEKAKVEDDIIFGFRKTHRFVCSFKPSLTKERRKKKEEQNKKKNGEDTSPYLSFNRFERTSLK
jgi:hypothetical protein